MWFIVPAPSGGFGPVRDPPCLQLGRSRINRQSQKKLNKSATSTQRFATSKKVIL